MLGSLVPGVTVVVAAFVFGIAGFQCGADVRTLLLLWLCWFWSSSAIRRRVRASRRTDLGATENDHACRDRWHDLAQ